MVIDTDKVGEYMMAHLRVVLTCSFWAASWFSAVKCTGQDPPGTHGTSSTIEIFWFLTSAFFFILSCLATVFVLDKTFSNVISKSAS